MSLKQKGINTERQLVHMFWNTGRWAAHRIAGSGSSKYPSPDIIASNNLRRVAIEVKTTKSSSVYISKQEIEALVRFSSMFGAEPWVAVKFDRDDTYFMTLEDMDETCSSFSVSREKAKMKGLLFDELVSG
ncbi:Holliday junction resolvase [Candidatus Woesearchaeota archaeon]|nr:Holliday junction resolvase [Candidatus Woesearchaeota archaeon]